MDIVLGIVLIAAAIFLIVAVLMQEGKNEGLSGALSGASNASAGKGKEQSRSQKLSKITSIIAVVFVIIVLAVSVKIAWSKDAKKGAIDDNLNPDENKTEQTDDKNSETTDGSVVEDGSSAASK